MHILCTAKSINSPTQNRTGNRATVQLYNSSKLCCSNHIYNWSTYYEDDISVIYTGKHLPSDDFFYKETKTEDEIRLLLGHTHHHFIEPIHQITVWFFPLAAVYAVVEKKMTASCYCTSALPPGSQTWNCNIWHLLVSSNRSSRTRYMWYLWRWRIAGVSLLSETLTCPNLNRMSQHKGRRRC